jgi:16S rRNA (cytidine1402-2'-O)-methyltransferase
VLREVDVVAAEDTRRTRALLAHHGIARPVTSYYDAVERRKTPALVARLLDGAKIALVTDAGTPGSPTRISPGARRDRGGHFGRAGAGAVGADDARVRSRDSRGALRVRGLPPEPGGCPRGAAPAVAAEPRALVFYEAAPASTRSWPTPRKSSGTGRRSWAAS